MIDKIKKDITERSIRKNFSFLSSAGKSQHEFNYRYCKSDMSDLENYYFVVSHVIKYKGNSMDDYGYVVYVYDSNGDYVEDPKIVNKCIGKFFSSLKDIE